MNRERIKATTEETRKRQTVLTKSRSVVLVKVLGADSVEGLEEKDRNDFAIEAGNRIESAVRNLDPNAYQRPRADTGFCLFQKESAVRITDLVKELQALGLRYTGGHYQMVEGKNKPVQTFQFGTEGEEIPIPQAVQELLASRFGDVSVWCNLRYRQEGAGQFRLDTVNLNGPHTPKKPKPSRELTVVGNTYRLV